MPIVTVDPNATEKFPLKTAPADPNDPNDEDGWVQLRALPYGKKLTRRDKSTKMKMQAQTGKNESQDIELESLNEWAVAYDFAYCIVDHNLLNRDKSKIDFSKPFALTLLDPKVGTEIEKLINSLNEDEGEQTLEDFLGLSKSSSTEDSTDSMNVVEAPAT